MLGRNVGENKLQTPQHAITTGIKDFWPVL